MDRKPDDRVSKGIQDKVSEWTLIPQTGTTALAIAAKLNILSPRRIVELASDRLANGCNDELTLRLALLSPIAGHSDVADAVDHYPCASQTESEAARELFIAISDWVQRGDLAAIPTCNWVNAVLTPHFPHGSLLSFVALADDAESASADDRNAIVNDIVEAFKEVSATLTF